MATALKFPRVEREPQAEPVTEFFIFDVETMNPPAKEMERLEREFLAEWEPPGNLKDAEKINGRQQADLEKFRDRIALHDAAPVAMVGLMFEDKTFLLHSLGRDRVKWFGKRENRVSIEGFRGERELIGAVYAVLSEKTTEKMQGVGHNIFGFDLAKLRIAGVRNGLTLPDALRVVMDEEEERQRFVDTMTLYCKYFARRGEIMISQERMLERLGVESLLKGVANGGDVPKLLAAGKLNEVATKLLADLVGVREAYLRMTGRER